MCKRSAYTQQGVITNEVIINQTLLQMNFAWVNIVIYSSWYTIVVYHLLVVNYDIIDFNVPKLFIIFKFIGVKN